jgi:hypothetical protein
MKNMRLILTFCFFICGLVANAQYYYKDIITNKENTANNKAIRKANCTSLEVKSYHFDGEEIESFLCRQVIENSAKLVLTITGSPYTGGNHLHSFYTLQGQLQRSVDSNASLVIQNNYEYQADKLTKISVTSFEPEQKNIRNTEIHQWIYDEKGTARKMLRIKNQTDTSILLFAKDSITNLVINEVEYVKGKVKEHYQYFYDDNHNLTAIFRYNPVRKKMLPELVLDYNDKNEIIKKTNFSGSANNTTFWYYYYNDSGLKTEEQCFLTGNLFKGKLKYFYTYD